MSTLPAPVVSPAFQWGRRWHAGGRHVVLVANGSASGLGRKREALERARGALGLWGSRVETHVTTNVDELTELWPSFQERRVVLLGGDGSLHAAANLPFGPPELAILPAGRANNIARALGIPLELRKAAELATNGRPRQLDLIAATAGPRTYLAVEGVSVGLHAVARASYQAPNSADVAAAVRSGLRAARRFAGVTVCVSTDGVPELLTVGQLFVANLSLFAFGLKVAPGARPDDGLLDPGERARRPAPIPGRLRRGGARRRARPRCDDELPPGSARPDRGRAREDRHGHARQRGSGPLRTARRRVLERPPSGPRRHEKTSVRPRWQPRGCRGARRRRARLLQLLLRPGDLRSRGLRRSERRHDGTPGARSRVLRGGRTAAGDERTRAGAPRRRSARHHRRRRPDGRRTLGAVCLGRGRRARTGDANRVTDPRGGGGRRDRGQGATTRLLPRRRPPTGRLWLPPGPGPVGARVRGPARFLPPLRRGRARLGGSLRLALPRRVRRRDRGRRPRSRPRPESVPDAALAAPRNRTHGRGLPRRVARRRPPPGRRRTRVRRGRIRPHLDGRLPALLLADTGRRGRRLHRAFLLSALDLLDDRTPDRRMADRRHRELPIALRARRAGDACRARASLAQRRRLRAQGGSGAAPPAALAGGLGRSTRLARTPHARRGPSRHFDPPAVARRRALPAGERSRSRSGRSVDGLRSPHAQLRPSRGPCGHACLARATAPRGVDAHGDAGLGARGLDPARDRVRALRP